MKRSVNEPMHMKVKEQAMRVFDTAAEGFQAAATFVIAAANKTPTKPNAGTYVAAGKIESIKPNARAMRMANKR